MQEISYPRFRRLCAALGVGLLALAGLLLLLGLHPRPALADPGDLFVEPGGSGDCSQANPCSLQTALGSATGGDTIYVAQGTYTGSGGAVVTVTQSIALCGGWDGSPTGPVVRDPEAYPTTLDGENARRVVYISGDISPTIEGLRITGGDAGAEDGGGVYVTNAMATISNCRVFSNAADDGGGVYVNLGSVVLSGGQILSNTATKGGGVYINQTTAAFTQTGASTIAHNIASGTGLVDGGGGVYVAYGSATLSGGQIVSNTASNDGGGVYVYYGSATLEGGQIVSNKANDAGGGAFVFGSSASLNVSRGQIVGNTARGGGGVYNRSGTLSLVNTTVSRNAASSYAGGGLWNQNSGAASVLTYTTVASNTALSGGGGINRASGTVLLQNTIVAYNGTANCSGGVTSNGHNLEYGDTCGFTATTDITDTNPLLGPLTHDRGTWVHPLLEGSPAIDAGVCVAGITTDQRGVPRPQGATCDIGAYEFYCYALTGVTITGPVTGTVDTTYTFTATVAPPTATLPITYTWLPQPDAGQGNATVTYTWATTGTKAITVAAENCGGVVSNTHTIAIVAPPPPWRYVYLPLVMKGHP